MVGVPAQPGRVRHDIWNRHKLLELLQKVSLVGRRVAVSCLRRRYLRRERQHEYRQRDRHDSGPDSRHGVKLAHGTGVLLTRKIADLSVSMTFRQLNIHREVKLWKRFVRELLAQSVHSPYRAKIVAGRGAR
jgi:hypothetical protein